MPPDQPQLLNAIKSLERQREQIEQAIALTKKALECTAGVRVPTRNAKTVVMGVREVLRTCGEPMHIGEIVAQMDREQHRIGPTLYLEARRQHPRVVLVAKATFGLPEWKRGPVAVAK